MLDPNSPGQKIAQLVQASAPPAGEKVTQAQLTQLWQGIVGIIYTDLKTNGMVLPGTFTSPTGPVSGTGQIS